jgi:hypothetical protein
MKGVLSLSRVDKNRSLNFLRTRLIYLGASLELKVHTEKLIPDVIRKIRTIDGLITRKSSSEDAHTRAMALLRGSVNDLQMVVSALWTRVNIIDKLNPDSDLLIKFFPNGLSKFTRKSGKGIADIIEELKGFLVLSQTLENMGNEFMEILNLLTDNIQIVEERLSQEKFHIEEKSRILEESYQFKTNLDQFNGEMEEKLKAIYKRNKKLVSSFFMP